jgi:hypothetical protein
MAGLQNSEKISEISLAVFPNLNNFYKYLKVLALNLSNKAGANILE